MVYSATEKYVCTISFHIFTDWEPQRVHFSCDGIHSFHIRTSYPNPSSALEILFSSFFADIFSEETEMRAQHTANILQMHTILEELSTKCRAQHQQQHKKPRNSIFTSCISHIWRLFISISQFLFLLLLMWICVCAVALVARDSTTLFLVLGVAVRLVHIIKNWRRPKSRRKKWWKL